MEDWEDAALMVGEAGRGKWGWSGLRFGACIGFGGSIGVEGLDGSVVVVVVGGRVAIVGVAVALSKSSHVGGFSGGSGVGVGGRCSHIERSSGGSGVGFGGGS